MAGGITGVQNEMDRLRRELDAFERQAVQALKNGARVTMQALFNETVVWEGDVVRNYVWSRGGYGGRGAREPIGGRYIPGSSKQYRTVNPGPTGSMGRPPAGEPRRAANEAAARVEMEALLGSVKHLEDLFVRNVSPHADLVDNGNAPTRSRARHPGGVARLAEQHARARLRGTFR